MPELPEVEYAAGGARRAAQGETIVRVRTLHPALRRTLPNAAARSLAGEVVRDVVRRGKHQLLRLASGRTLHVHFRMTGDWSVLAPGQAPGAYARVLIEFANGHRLALDDPRALSVVSLHPRDHDPLPALGPEATDRAFSPEWMAAAFAKRRGPVKPALLDQRVVAGIGNIYACEALWYARVAPECPVNRLNDKRRAAIVAGVRRSMRRALDRPERYYGTDAVRDTVRFNVYDREGKGCRRCRTPIARIVQAGRSTYYCPTCQR